MQPFNSIVKHKNQLPIKRCVSKKGPKWFVAIVNSKPSSVTTVFDSAVPALCTSTSKRLSFFKISAANSRIDFCDDRSNFFRMTFWLLDVLMISSVCTEKNMQIIDELCSRKKKCQRSMVRQLIKNNATLTLIFVEHFLIRKQKKCLCVEIEFKIIKLFFTLQTRFSIH